MTRTKDPFDELAAMFLTEADEAEASDPQRDSALAVMIELLVVAHLPVRGGLWLTPYADAVNSRCSQTVSASNSLGSSGT